MSGSMMLLPPGRGLCKVCATKHDPELPHNAQSFYYLVAFKMQHGREPSWSDAMAHCTDEVREQWTAELRKRGQQVPDGEGGQA